MHTVAEGVTSEAQRLFLVEQGCPLAQGRCFGDPVPAAELTAALRDAVQRLKRSGPFRPI